MPSTTVTVGSSVGLHARPAAIISTAAQGFDAAVTIAKPGDAPKDAGSSLMIMTLGANHGDEVVVDSEDEAAMRRIASLVEQDLDDEDWVDDEGNLDEEVD